MKANFKIKKDEEQNNNEELSSKEKEITNEEFIKKGMNVWTYRSKSGLNIK
ncbi:hypothetical protein [Nitrosopumilus sp. b3]|uniref:hypothetical protein n=1 Tax=Nitrosopumilus sp. b3 TaxID=2109909 RepID=UPI0015F358F8|nr:hypothetical protein [Nitrosopumilus sp. b3]